jgi:hypothetical protein
VLPDLLIANVTFDVASRAAELRGKTGLPSRILVLEDFV